MNSDRHEKIHAKVANRLGHRAKIMQRNGEIFTEVTWRHDPSPIEVAAIAIAPHLLGASKKHVVRDLALFNKEINKLPYRERSKGRREARALARKLGR